MQKKNRYLWPSKTWYCPRHYGPRTEMVITQYTGTCSVNWKNSEPKEYTFYIIVKNTNFVKCVLLVPSFLLYWVWFSLLSFGSEFCSLYWTSSSVLLNYRLGPRSIVSKTRSRRTLYGGDKRLKRVQTGNSCRNNWTCHPRVRTQVSTPSDL